MVPLRLGMRLPLLPAELLRAAVERFLDEGAGGMRQFPVRGRRSKGRLALRRIDAPHRHLIDAELARGLRQQPSP